MKLNQKKLRSYLHHDQTVKRNILIFVQNADIYNHNCKLVTEWHEIM